MKPDDVTLSAEQLAAYTALQRIRMAWTTLGVVLLLFSTGFVCFLVAVFKVPEQTVSKLIVGGIDTLLGFSLRAVINNLFPPPK